jgi:hypothetical protein
MTFRHVKTTIKLFFFAAVLVTATQAEAASTGEVFRNFGDALGGNFPRRLLTWVSYLLGLLFSIQGIFKFKDHVDESSGGRGTNQAPLSGAVKKFLAGGALLSGPYIGGALQGTLFGNSNNQMIQTSGTHAAPGGDGMDSMIVKFIQDVADYSVYALLAFAYVSAVILLITGIVRMTKSSQEGPRGPSGLGTMMTFIAAAGLFSFGDMIVAFSNSFFGGNAGTGGITVYANIGSNIVSDADDREKVAAIVEALMIFVLIVGLIAFMRGLFVLKAFADGSQQATISQALTFLIGGTLAINLGQVVNAVERSVGLTAANSITFG